MRPILLPWPDTVLFPNGSKRAHWATVSKATKLAREAAYFTAQAHGVPKQWETESIKVHVIFEQPDKRRRDWDGMIGSIKAYLDGISDFIGVDDSKFKLSFEFLEERKKPGCVIMELSNAST